MSDLLTIGIVEEKSVAIVIVETTTREWHGWEKCGEGNVWRQRLSRLSFSSEQKLHSVYKNPKQAARVLQILSEDRDSVEYEHADKHAPLSYRSKTPINYVQATTYHMEMWSGMLRTPLSYEDAIGHT